MPGTSTQGIKTVLYPVSDLAEAKTVYTALLGVPPEVDSSYANLDEGAMWPTSFALKQLTAAEEARIGALVKKAVS
jgi:hypothetical protein